MASTFALLILTTVVILVCFGQSQDQEATAHLVPLEANADTLVYLQVAWRHGDRTPATPVPFSDASTWSEGLGELTRKGIAQQYRLGKWLKARYGMWFGNRFDRSEIFIRSSDYNRTIMSAQANMAGLFPPTKSEIWDKEMPWQPIPVHTVPKAIDKELYEDINCPTIKQEFSALWRSDLVRRMESENKELVEYLREKTGIPHFEFRQLWMVFDNLFCMLQHNDTHKWPSWVNASIFDRIHKLYDASSRLKYHTDVLRRLRGGPLLKDIIQRFEAKINGNLGEKPKLYAYSAHDTTLAAMLAAMGIYPERFPPYASAVLLELHKKDGRLVLEVYYKNVTDVDELYHYNIPGCEDPCTLDAFKSAMYRYLPDDWTAECGLAGPNVKNYMISTAVLALTTVLLAGVLIVDVVLKRKRRFSIVTNPLMADEEEC
uniref:Lysosomal acid phosphatase n=1 Tax=Haemonchus contortus TaxID=6289 RepID=A0A7I4YBG4_HAECO|nr:Histidine acid phosphatase domain containing protein [Haemonchus contortus]